MAITKIATVTVGVGGAASIGFTGIPQTGKDLVIVFSLKPSAGNNNAYLLFNSSTTTFSSRSLQGIGSAAASLTRTDNVFGGFAGLDPNFSSGQIYIPNYADSLNKSFSIDTVTENNGTVAISNLFAGLWATGGAITTLSITAVDLFTQYSTASLYTISTTGATGATVS